MILARTKPEKKQASQPLAPITVHGRELSAKLAELEAGGWWVQRMDVKGATYTLYPIKDESRQAELKGVLGWKA